MRLNTYFHCLAIALIFAVSAKDCKKSAGIDCYQDRQTVKTIVDTEGRISKQGNNYIIILSGGQQQRYSPCNMGPQWKFDNKAIIVSGEEKEVYSHERWAGLPFVIKEIKDQ